MSGADGELVTIKQHASANGFIIGADVVQTRQALACIGTVNRAHKHGEDVAWLDMDTLDLSILESGQAPILLDHLNQVESVVGVIERAWIDGDELLAVLRFADTPLARNVVSLIGDRILTNLSIGFTMETTGEGDGPGCRKIIRWRPYEVSLVAVPANWRAGFRPGPVPLRILRAATAALRGGADGTASSWRAWADAAAVSLAGLHGEAEIKGKLAELVDRELIRLSLDKAAPS